MPEQGAVAVMGTDHVAGTLLIAREMTHKQGVRVGSTASAQRWSRPQRSAVKINNTEQGTDVSPGLRPPDRCGSLLRRSVCSTPALIAARPPGHSRAREPPTAVPRCYCSAEKNRAAQVHLSTTIDRSDRRDGKIKRGSSEREISTVVLSRLQ